MYFSKTPAVILICALVSLPACASFSETATPTALTAESPEVVPSTAHSVSNDIDAQATLPEPVITSHPAVRKQFAGREQILLKYRKSENLPEITNEALLTGIGDEKAARGTIGTIPRLTILPCDEGCKGNSDYENAIKKFVKNYEEGIREGTSTYRGQMTIKVRWFNQRGYFKRKAGVLSGSDVFAISFPVEGKLVTLSYRDGGPDADMDGLVVTASGTLAVMLLADMGRGIKPHPLLELLPESDRKFARKLNDSLRPIAAAIEGFLGNADYRSRIEPMTEAYADLLPAVDGILPNEIDPLDKVVYFNHF